MEKRNERILSIELLRFLFCLIIIGYHFCSHYLIQYVNKSETPLFFSRGYIADEFFFVTSGFFFANSVLHESNKDSSLSYLLKRIKRIAFPYYTCWIVSFIIIQVSKFIIDHGSFPMWSGYVNHYNFSGSIWKDLFNSLYELLFVDMLGFKHGFYSNPVAWFISATLITFFMIMPFLKKGGRKYTIYVAPLFSFFIYAVLSQRFDFINAPHSNMFSITHINSEIEALAEAYGTSSGLIPIYKGLFRSFAGINLGIFIFGITETQEITIKNIVLVRIAVSILYRRTCGTFGI